MNGVGGPLAAALRRAAARAGAPGAIRFTERQLYYEMCRTLQPLGRLPRRPGFTVPAPIGYRRFQAVRHRAGAIAGLLTGARPGPSAPPAEVFDYGLPRVLLCQHRDLADMLLANRLHMESACPVFALDDLPLDPRLPAAVRRGEGSVYVLHDASLAGLAAVATVRAWAGGLAVTPLGLRPAHAAALHLPRIRAGAEGDPGPLMDALAPWEQRWLRAGHAAEVAAVNPARLLRTVHRLVRNQIRPRRGLPRMRRLAAAGFLDWPSVPGGAT
jgi:hypothetical protein